MHYFFRSMVLVMLLCFLTRFVFGHINSENGVSLPANGEIRVLVIFAELDCEPCVAGTPGCVLNYTAWPPHALPRNVVDASGLDVFNKTWFNHTLSGSQTPTPGNLTSYFYDMSFGDYRVLGDYYPEIITVPCNSKDQDLAVFEAINNKTITNGSFTTAHGYNLNDFDLWDNSEPGAPKNKLPNKSIDAIQIVWRNIQDNPCVGGLGMAPNYTLHLIHNAGFEHGQPGFIYDNGTLPNTVCDKTNIDPFRGSFHGRSQGNSLGIQGGQHDASIITDQPITYYEHRQYQVQVTARSEVCAGNMRIVKSDTPTHVAMTLASGSDVILDGQNNNVSNMAGYNSFKSPVFISQKTESKYLGIHLSSDGGTFCNGSAVYIDDVRIFESYTLLQTPFDDYRVFIGSRLQSCNAESGVFIGEYFHALFGRNEWHTGGGLGRITFLTYPQNFSMTSYSHVGNIISGFDRQHLGWYGWEDISKQFKKSDLISALDASTGNEVNFEEYSVLNNPSGGEYILRDFVNYGDAIRIKLPMGFPRTEWDTLGDPKNQYLWIENHQKLSVYDIPKHEGNGCTDPWTRGLYAYIQVGKDQKDTSIVEDIFFSGDPRNPNSLGSWLYPLTAEGNYDFKYHYNLAGTCPTQPTVNCCWGHDYIPIERDHPQTKPNPFTGMSDLFNIIDDDGDDRIRNIVAEFPYQAWTAEVINGTVEYSLYAGGDSEDGYHCRGLCPEKILSLNTNPAPVPIYTWISNPNNDQYITDSVPSFENRTIWLNGLSVEIISGNVDLASYGQGAIKVKIRWDDYIVDQDVRWCGNIALGPNDVNHTSASLVVDEHTTVLLDRGLSPTQHLKVPGTPYFTQPTEFRCYKGSYAALNPHSTVIVDNESKFLMDPYSRVDVFHSAELQITNNSEMRVGTNASLAIKSGGSIKVKSGGTLIIEPDADVEITSNGSIHVEPGGTLIIEEPGPDNAITYNHNQSWLKKPELLIQGTLTTLDSVDFQFEGSNGEGLLVFNSGAKITLGQDSRFIVQGQNKTQKLVEVRGGSTLVEAREVIIKDCQFDYIGGGTFGVKDGWLKANNATFQQNGQSLSSGLTCDNSDALIQYCDFIALAKGIEIINTPPVNTTFPMDYIRVEQCAFNQCDKGTYVENATKDVRVSKSAFKDCERGLHAVNSNCISSIENDYTNNVIGIGSKEVYALYSDGDDMDFGKYGIEGSNSNVFLRNRTRIQNMTAGVWMNSTGTIPSKLTMGDIGCAWVMNNDIGIRGFDLVLSIDAEVHACNRGNCTKIIPNRFDGNDLMFSLCYDSFIPPGLEMKGNFWGTKGNNPFGVGEPLSSFSYHTGAGKFCKSVTIPIQDNHIKRLQPNCGFMANPLPQPGKIPFLGSMSIRQAPGSSRTITEDFIEAYKNFVAESYDISTGQFEAIGRTNIENGTFNSIDEQQVRVSRALSTVSNAHDVASGGSSSNKRTDVRDTENIDTNVLPTFFSIRPNPARHELLVECTKQGNYVISMTSILGQIVHTEHCENKQTVINTSQFERGIYFIKVVNKSNWQAEVLKVVLQ